MSFRAWSWRVGGERREGVAACVPLRAQARTIGLILVFEPIRLLEFQALLNIRQPLHAVMTNAHPLAEMETVRLRDCLQFPLALPEQEYGVRQLLEAAVRRTSLTLDPVVVSDSFEFLRSHAVAENILAFQIPIGLPVPDEASRAVSRPVHTTDVPPGLLYFGQLRGRTLRDSNTKGPGTTRQRPLDTR